MLSYYLSFQLGSGSGSERADPARLIAMAFSGAPALLGADIPVPGTPPTPVKDSDDAGAQASASGEGEKAKVEVPPGIGTKEEPMDDT